MGHSSTLSLGFILKLTTNDLRNIPYTEHTITVTLRATSISLTATTLPVLEATHGNEGYIFAQKPQAREKTLLFESEAESPRTEPQTD